jgi:uncharacterized membrane protein YeaQ/YmgE (transglycosylase-associated protein family)
MESYLAFGFFVGLIVSALDRAYRLRDIVGNIIVGMVGALEGSFFFSLISGAFQDYQPLGSALFIMFGSLALIFFRMILMSWSHHSSEKYGKFWR